MFEDQQNILERLRRSSEVVVGIPIAFVGFGLTLAMATVSYFSIGIIIAIAGIIWLLVYWSTKIRTMGSLISILSAAVVVLLLLLRGAPLLISAFAQEGDFEEGTVIGGIEWQNNYSEIRLNLDNPQYWPYTNIAIIIRSDLPIAKVGALSPHSQCTSASDFPVNIVAPELKITGKKGSRETLPLFTPESPGVISDQYKILCNKISGKSNLELLIAVVPGLFQKHRETAYWLSVVAEYEAFGKFIRQPRHLCFKEADGCTFVDPLEAK
jgi:hypothetical protein